MLSCAVTMPSFEAQAALIKHVYSSNGLDYSTQYVEAHASQRAIRLRGLIVTNRSIRVPGPKPEIQLRQEPFIAPS